MLTRLAPRLLRDRSEDVRLEAATVLGAAGGEGVSTALHEAATSDESEQVRSGAWIGLVSLGSRLGTGLVLPTIVDSLRHGERSSVRMDAARALVGLGEEAALAPLAAAAATDPVQTVRVAARVAHDELRRRLDLSDEDVAVVAHAGPELDLERPPAREEAPRRRRPGTALLVSGGVLAGVGLAAAITGFALLPRDDDLSLELGLGLGIPGVLVAATGVVLVVLGLLRRLGPEERRPRSALAASLGLEPASPRALSFAGPD